MLFYKIYLMNPYDTENEISNRPLLRGYKKLGINCLVDDDKPCIIVYVDEGMFVREFFTREFLRKSSFCNNPYSESEDILKFNDLIRFKAVAITKEELYAILPLGQNKDFIKVIQKAIFDLDNDFELTNIEESNQDKGIQFEAFDKKLTTIHPYSERYKERAALRYKR